MFFFDDFFIEPLVGGDAGGEFLVVDGAPVLLEGADEAAVVLEHLAVEAE
jgi:hypothetical protein